MNDREAGSTTGDQSVAAGIDVHQIASERPDRIAEALDVLCESLGRRVYLFPELLALAGGEGSVLLGAARESKEGPLVGVAIAERLSPAERSFYRQFGQDAADLIGCHDAGSLSGLAVRANARRQGVGRTLTREAMRWLSGKGCDLVVAVSWISNGPNPSWPLFESLGFQLIARAPDVYLEASLNRGLECPVCNGHCRCSGALYMFDLCRSIEAQPSQC